MLKITQIFIYLLVTQRVFGWDLSSQAYYAVYGNITTIEDLFLPDLSENVDMDIDDTDTDTDTDPLQGFRQVLDDSVQITTIEEIFNTKNDPGVMTIDEKQLHDLDTQVHTITRRKSPWCKDKDQCTLYDPIQFQNSPEETEYMPEEERKIGVLRDVCLGFLIHTRREVQKALDQRQKVRHDKRYRIGYLFNRLRRLRLEMGKIINSAHAYYPKGRPMGIKKSEDTMESTANNLTFLVRAYEQVSRYDVDIKDTIKLIKTIYNEPAAFDNDRK